MLVILATFALFAVNAPVHADSASAQIGFASLTSIAVNGEASPAIVGAGAPVSISTDYVVDHTLTDGSVYCPGCIDHIPTAFQGFGAQPSSTNTQQCFGQGGGNHVFHGSSGSDTVDLGPAPTQPGTYNIVASFEFTYWCGQYWDADAASVIARIVVMPTSTSDCKKGGWENFAGYFVNQGDCVSFVATGGKNQPAGN